jgi:hypothetical protein
LPSRISDKERNNGYGQAGEKADRTAAHRRPLVPGGRIPAIYPNYKKSTYANGISAFSLFLQKP